MYTLEAVENEILLHLYELGILSLHGGWERQSDLDGNAVERLCRAKLVERNTSSPGFIRLSERGVGTVLFGLYNAEKIKTLL
jgi:hypothetical protein